MAKDDIADIRDKCLKNEIPHTWVSEKKICVKNIETIKEVFKSTQSPIHRMGIIEFVMKKDYFSKKNKLGFLIYVLEMDPSLNVLEHAGRFFQQETNSLFIFTLIITKIIQYFNLTTNTFRLNLNIYFYHLYYILNNCNHLFNFIIYPSIM